MTSLISIPHESVDVLAFAQAHIAARETGAVLSEGYVAPHHSCAGKPATHLKASAPDCMGNCGPSSPAGEAGESCVQQAAHTSIGSEGNRDPMHSCSLQQQATLQATGPELQVMMHIDV